MRSESAESLLVCLEIGPSFGRPGVRAAAGEDALDHEIRGVTSEIGTSSGSCRDRSSRARRCTGLAGAQLLIASSPRMSWEESADGLKGQSEDVLTALGASVVRERLT